MKIVGAILGALVSLWTCAAYAQAYSEAQKRRLHLPYIRAATDCYANTIAANTTALDIAREGRWHDAIRATGDACNSLAGQMVRTHDQIYGSGTGLPFYQGPYLEDLPRAISARLKDVIARRNVEVEQADTARKARLSEANRARDLLRDRVYACTKSELTSLVASSETAEILATAAMTLCNREVQAALDAAMEAYRLDGGTDLRVRDELRTVIQRNVVTSAVQARAAFAKSTSPVVATPEPAVARQSLPATDAIDRCLKTASSVREGQLVAQEKLIDLMLDLCRPEIENAARLKYLDDPKQDLGEIRRTAAESALAQARSLVGSK